MKCGVLLDQYQRKVRLNDLEMDEPFAPNTMMPLAMRTQTLRLDKPMA